MENGSLTKSGSLLVRKIILTWVAILSIHVQEKSLSILELKSTTLFIHTKGTRIC